MKTMRALLKIGDKYVKKSSWRDFAVVKFCLFAMGLLAGTHIAERDKKNVNRAAALVFVITYFPLMAKVLKVACDKEQ